MIRAIVVGVVAATLMAIPAGATLYNFSYAATGGTLQGQLDGTLLADNNTIFVNSITDFVSFAGVVPGVSLPSLFGGDYFGGGISDPTVTLDGSVMSITACDAPLCSQGFVLAAPDSLFGVSLFASSEAFGAAMELYSAASWSISAAVPEPASWALMIAGFGLVGANLRRRAAIAA